MNGHHAIWIFIGGTSTLLLFATSLVIFLVVHKRKQFTNLLEKQQMENNYQNQLLQSKLEVQEQSFKYFSEEVHDNIAHALTIVKMNLLALVGDIKEPEVATNLATSTDIVAKAIRDLRSVSHTLSSYFVSNVGLSEAVEKEFSYVTSIKKVTCQLLKTGDEYRLGNERELLVFRIIQEAIGNALKHGGPTAINVNLDYNPDHLAVDIIDNGRGFDTLSNTKSGIGLNNMQVRARLLEGKLDITSSTEGGTVVHFEISRSQEIKQV